MAGERITSSSAEQSAASDSEFLGRVADRLLAEHGGTLRKLAEDEADEHPAAHAYDGGRDDAHTGAGKAGGLRGVGGASADRPVSEGGEPEDLLRDVPGRVGAARSDAAEVTPGGNAAIREELIGWLRWVIQEGDPDTEGSAHQEALRRLMELEAWRPEDGDE